MGQDSKIEWTDHTFNPWWGCTKVSPACDHCYAETWAHRLGKKLWGPSAPRPVASEKLWKDVEKWNAAAAAEGVRRRVFCASMGDICEDRDDLLEPRARLMRLIERTPALDWLLLTKRPENFNRFFGIRWGKRWPRNVVAMATAENQERLNRNVAHLAEVPALRRGLSLEPMVGPMTLETALWEGVKIEIPGEPPEWDRVPRQVIDWVIVGGESGHKPRPLHPEWARRLRDECAAVSVAFFFKQWGEFLPLSQHPNRLDVKSPDGGETFDLEAAPGHLYPFTAFKVGKKAAGRLLDGRTHDNFPLLSDE